MSLPAAINFVQICAGSYNIVQCALNANNYLQKTTKSYNIVQPGAGLLRASLGIDTTGMIKTEEEVQQEMQQAQEQQMIAQMAVKGMGNNGNPSEL